MKNEQLLELGITGHKDLGSRINKQGLKEYNDKIYLGPFEHLVTVTEQELNYRMADAKVQFGLAFILFWCQQPENGLLTLEGARYQNLKEAVPKFLEDVKQIQIQHNERAFLAREKKSENGSAFADFCHEPDNIVLQKKVKTGMPSSEKKTFMTEYLANKMEGLEKELLEQQILGYILSHGKKTNLTELLSCHDFRSVEHSVIFEHIVKHKRNPNLLSVCSSMRKAGVIGKVGGAVYLAKLTTLAPNHLGTLPRDLILFEY